ncbi:cytochrome P450 [Phascolomyces articulosus]|uniref:Cytochrome P450 n=1 Tax=Phascolomyces articulosus TaxID=60185 RepID=A0AAD5PEH0_9FUNG|nr:cytochrome P450 [Phascolomyces articulosus]
MDLQRDASDLYKAILKNTTPGNNNATIAAVLSLGACAWLLLRSSHSASSSKAIDGSKEIPEPKGGLPYLGHMFALGNQPVTQLNQWHEELGPIYSIRMGVKQWVFVNDPYLAHEIFNVNGRFTADRPHTTFFMDHYALGGKGIAGANPSLLWKRTRAAAFQILSPKNRPMFEKLHVPEADMLIENLLEATEKEGSVNVTPLLQFTTVNVIIATCFGKRAESRDDQIFKDITELVHEASFRASAPEELSSYLPIWTILDILFQKKKKMRGFIERRNHAIQRLVDEALENNVDCFAKSLFEQEGLGHDPENILVTLSDSALAGSETSATMLSWSMVILCRYPEIQKILRDEVDQFIRTHGRLPTFDDRDSLPYSNSVQKECMRFMPITHLGLPHETNQEIVCHGYRIPKGTTVFCNMQSMHRNATFYTEPSTFIPDRFLNDSKPMYASANSRPEGRDQFNFGWGRRTCPGAFLAELEIFNVYVRLFSKCIIEPVKNETGVPIYPDLDKFDQSAIVSVPNNPVVRVIKRTDALI